MNPAQVKKNAKKMAQAIGEEPLEILKTAKKQISGEKINSTPDVYQHAKEQNTDPDIHQSEEQRKQQVAIADRKNLEALQGEMREIRRQRLFNSLLARIQNGEDVPIEEFQELGHEQKDVLKAQLEAAGRRRDAEGRMQKKQLNEPISKKARGFRGFGKGRKNPAEKQQTRVEMPLPPSG